MNQPEELLLRNATIWAGKPIRKIKGYMKIRQGKIAEVTEHDGDASVKGKDMKNAHIVPGLIDAHRHFFVSALLPLYGNADSWTSKDDALSAIQEACRSRERDKPWIFFSGLDNTRWKRPALPRQHEIDDVAAGSPVLVVDTTFHRGLVSTAALRRIDMSRSALQWPMDIDLCRDGTPKGTIWEYAVGRVLFHMYREMFRSYSEEEKRRIVLDEADRCLQRGLTHVHDPGIPSDVQRIMRDAQAHTRLKMSWSVTDYESLLAPPDVQDDLDALHSDHAPKSAKFFLDGANRTAASMPIIAGLKAALRAAKDSVSTGSFFPLHQLFDQKSTLKGGKIYLPYLRFADTGELVRRAGFFMDRGYRLVMHALGNVAASQAACVVRELGAGAVSSIEHVLVMDHGGLDPFAASGAVASIQPGFIPFYADTIERMGAVPYLKTFPLRSLLDRGVCICISSDGPCAADDPLHNIRRAVDRKKPDGSVLDPEERISEVQALAAGTLGASSSLGLKNDGLCEGASATFCVVDRDPFSESSRVVQTWIEGERVY